MSARFQFRLARVKRAREVEEEVARSIWARAEAAAGVQETACDRQRERIAEIRAQLAGEAGRPLEPAQILVAHHALARALANLRERHERALTLRAQAEQLRGEWNERRRQVEALARLEDRRRNDFRQAETRREAAEMDEIALRRANSTNSLVPLESDSRSQATTTDNEEPGTRPRRQAS